MAENLNFDVSGSACYNNNSSNCVTYGRLYNWVTALTVCPPGWHLPSDAEWTALTDHAGSNAGTKLKASSGWDYDGNGTDDFGFSALPGGYGSSGYFIIVGYGGLWWSAAEYDASNAWFRDMYYNNSDVYRIGGSKEYLYSVRCVRD
jgi:uncharacterized protein (TIGR02145 family)